LSRSRRASIDLTLDPNEHPVLSSLQTLSITHPHPPEHYHPHLGHDLGHDRVPIAADSPAPPPPPAAAAPVEHNASSMKLNLPTTSSSTTSTSTTTTTITSATPSQHRTEQSHSSSPFPMDRGDRDSISGFGQQGLI
jgi:hypothetical protein